ncbi:MAG: T9SS type A sorting domain-containing protein [Flavipsychrobacter sp.]
MKKKALLLSVSLLAALQLFGQSQMKSSLNWNDVPHRYVKNLLQLQSRVGAKTTSPVERLKSSDYDWQYFTFNVDDSVKYIYSGGHGSTFDLNEMKYIFPTTPYDYDIPMAGTSYYVPRSMNILCDTAYAWGKDRTTGLYSPARSTYAHYDANNNLISYYNIHVDTTYNPDVHYENSFDASHRIVANIWFAHPAATWDTSAARYFTYNSSGQLIQDSLYSYTAGIKSLQTKYAYTYDGSGKPISVAEYDWDTATSKWFNSINYSLSYYSGGNLQSIYITEDTGTGMFPSYKDSMGYASGYNYFNFYQEYSYTDTGRTVSATIHKYIGATGLPDSVNTSELIYFYTSGGVVAQTLYFNDYYYYNSQNDPIAWVQYLNMGSGYQFNAQENFFYETLEGVTDVVTQPDIAIYPNPAKDIVNVKLSNGAVGKNITINLTNTLGQTVKTQNTTAQLNMQISVSDLVPGTYLMYIKEANGSLWRVQKIIKQ